MKIETDKNGNVKEYSFGDISVHRHILNPDDLYLTIRPLNIFDEVICPVNCTPKEIIECILWRINKAKKRN